MAKSSAKKIASGASKKVRDQEVNFPAANTNASLENLFISELKDTYWAERHLVKSLPKMISAAAGEDLQNALSEHLEVTIEQVARLEEAFELMGQKIVAKKCDAMEGLTMSGEHAIENTESGTSIRDTGIIMSGLKVENFEITTYTGLIQIANTLGKADVADLLKQNLEEEIEASNQLMQLSQQATEKFKV